MTVAAGRVGIRCQRWFALWLPSASAIPASALGSAPGSRWSPSPCLRTEGARAVGDEVGEATLGELLQPVPTRSSLV